MRGGVVRRVVRRVGRGIGAGRRRRRRRRRCGRRVDARRGGPFRRDCPIPWQASGESAFRRRGRSEVSERRLTAFLPADRSCCTNRRC